MTTSLLKTMGAPNYSDQSETKQVFNIFETFNRNAEELDAVDAPTLENSPILTMSSLGKFGRFGNQLFQYAFLKICARESGAIIECPAWIGQTLFGHSDPPIAHSFPPVIESKDDRETLFDVIPELVPYIEKLNHAKSCRINSDALGEGLKNVDLWGFFQLHTRHFLPYQDYFRSLFQPVDDLKVVLEDGLKFLQSKGNTIIGIHVRRGDFVTLPLAGFTLITPTQWFCDWLRQQWHEFDDPVLFVCSDDLKNVLPAFAEFSPLTWKDLPIVLPERMNGANAEFYIDFFILSHCDVVIISNSIFSFIACMLNQRAKRFIRPHWDFASKFRSFDPWNSEPLLCIGESKPKFHKSLKETSQITYATQGIVGLLKCIFIYIPQSFLRTWSLRVYLGYQVQGIIGIMKSLLYSLGWRSIWKENAPVMNATAAAETR